MLALPAPTDAKPKVFDPTRLADLSKPRQKAEDPNFKYPNQVPKKKKISRKQMLDQAKRVKIRQQKAIAIIEKKKQSAKDQILAITDGTVVGEQPRGSLDLRRKRII